RLAQESAAKFDFASAYDHYVECLRIKRNDGEVHFQAARAARRMSRFKEADYHLNECRRIDGPSPKLDLERVLFVVQQENSLNVELDLVKLLKDDPPEAALILEALVLGSRQRRMLGNEMVYLNQLLEKEPTNLLGLLMRGEHFERRQRFEDAE